VVSHFTCFEHPLYNAFKRSICSTNVLIFLVFELYVYVSVLTLYTNYFSFLVPRTDLSLKCTYQYCQIVISYFFFFLRDSC